MTEDRRPAPTPDSIVEMAAAVDLKIDKSRADVLQPWADLIFSLCDSLKAVDLGETPPAFAFKSRRSERET